MLRFMMGPVLFRDLVKLLRYLKDYVQVSENKFSRLKFRIYDIPSVFTHSYINNLTKK